MEEEDKKKRVKDDEDQIKSDSFQIYIQSCNVSGIANFEKFHLQLIFCATREQGDFLPIQYHVPDFYCHLLSTFYSFMLMHSSMVYQVQSDKAFSGVVSFFSAQKENYTFRYNMNDRICMIQSN